jgi:hypothetical protein
MKAHQLPLPIDAEIVPRTTGPALDRKTVAALRNINVEYLWTSWSHYYQEWHHHLRGLDDGQPPHRDQD